MKKILLVENNVFLINIYTSQLRKSGYSTSVVLDGETAIDRIKKNSPDLLILDDDLSKIDGLSVLKMLREDMGLKELKIVMLLNFNNEGAADNNSEFGVARFFSKAENTAEEIAEEIKQILN